MDESSPGGSLPDDSTLIGRTIGGYRVEVMLGRGGMGEVYLAQDTGFPRMVALKCMAPELRGDPEFVRRFLAEAEKAIRISDPRIAKLLHVLEDNGEKYLVLEYVPGPTLRQRLHGPLELDAFFPLAVECTEALAVAHRNGIVHRDIKPENYIVATTGAVKLLDLGVAKYQPYGTSSSMTTQPMTHNGRSGIAGTPSYIAPEVLLGEHADFRSDLFSLGTMFHEMLAGEHPFRGDTGAAANDHVLHDEPEPLVDRNPAITPELQQLIGRMMAKDREARPHSAHDVLHDLLEIQSLSPATLSPTTPWLKRLKWIVAASALTGAIAVGVLVARFVRPPLPVAKRVTIVSLNAPGDAPGARILAAGLTRVVYETLRRLTDPAALQGSGRVGPSFQPLQGCSLDDPTLGNLAFSGSLSPSGSRVRVQLVVSDPRDSSRLRQARFEAPFGDGVALAHRAVARAVELLELDVAPDQVAGVLHLGTQNGRALWEDLQGLGFLAAFEKEKEQEGRRSLPSDGAMKQVDGQRDAAARTRAALLDSAEAAFARGVAADSLDVDAWIGRALVAWEQRDGPHRAARLARSAELCQHVLGIDLTHAQSHALLGEIYAETGRSPAAIPELERALELDPTRNATLRRLAAQYRRAGRLEDVDRLYRAAIDRRPGYPYLYSLFGQFCFSQARYDEAAKLYQQAVELAPRDPVALASLGAVCLLQGRYQTAVPYLRRSVALRPRGAVFTNLGTALFLMRRFAAAESTYRRALELDDGSAVLWGNLGDALYWDAARRDQAEEPYRTALRLAERDLASDGENAAILGRIAHIRSQLGDRAAARSVLGRALELDPKNHDLLYRATLFYIRCTEIDSAFVFLEQALQAGYSPVWVMDTPELDALRQDARFPRLGRK
jgi:serine/threonine-protein kinase